MGILIWDWNTKQLLVFEKQDRTPSPIENWIYVLSTYAKGQQYWQILRQTFGSMCRVRENFLTHVNHEVTASPLCFQFFPVQFVFLLTIRHAQENSFSAERASTSLRKKNVINAANLEFNFFFILYFNSRKNFVCYSCVKHLFLTRVIVNIHIRKKRLTLHTCCINNYFG